MLMQLVLAYLRDKKDFRMSTLGLESSDDGQSKHSIQRKDTLDDADIEEYPQNINKTKVARPLLGEERESKKARKTKKHFIDIHDSDEEDKNYFETRQSEQKVIRKTRQSNASTNFKQL